MQLDLLSLNVGKVALLAVLRGGREIHSGIAKAPIPGPVKITKRGIEGDEQGDLSVHGGEDKAVYAYPSEHWAWWTAGQNLSCAPATFGENLTLKGATEDDVSIGDHFAWGEALLEICQPRAPCFKLDLHTHRSDAANLMLRSARCGWYFRVLREGSATSADNLVRTRASGGVTVRQSFVALHHSDASAELQKRVLAQPELSRAWRIGLQKSVANRLKQPRFL